MKKSIWGKMVSAWKRKLWMLPTADGGLTILVEPGITVLRDEQIIIGGRLNVQETIKLAEALNIELISAQHNYVRKTVSVLKNANPEEYPHIFAPKKIN